MTKIGKEKIKRSASDRWSGSAGSPVSEFCSEIWWLSDCPENLKRQRQTRGCPGWERSAPGSPLGEDDYLGDDVGLGVVVENLLVENLLAGGGTENCEDCSEQQRICQNSPVSENSWGRLPRTAAEQVDWAGLKLFLVRLPHLILVVGEC